jgi:2-keto-3-deoxy-L-rhamnonate aldolase RhmA
MMLASWPSEAQAQGGMGGFRVDPGRPWGWAIREFMENPNRDLFNTAKEKLLAGQQIYSLGISQFDPETYCNEGPNYDYVRFEMQHSTLRFDEIRAMRDACPNAAIIPFVRIKDGSEANIQTAVDLGMLGIIVPTVDDAMEARDIARYSRFPPTGRRSEGTQPASFWQSRVPAGQTWREAVNDNMLVIIMIETVEGVNNALEIAAQPGVDVVMIGNADMASFSGFEQGSPGYMDLLRRVRDATYEAGKFWGNANSSYSRDNPLAADSRFHMSEPPQ